MQQCFSVHILLRIIFQSFTFFVLMQMVLERYFSMSGEGTELVVPKSRVLQEKLFEGPLTDPDFMDWGCAPGKEKINWEEALGQKLGRTFCQENKIVIQQRYLSRYPHRKGGYFEGRVTSSIDGHEFGVVQLKVMVVVRLYILTLHLSLSESPYTVGIFVLCLPSIRKVDL